MTGVPQRNDLEDYYRISANSMGGTTLISENNPLGFV
jgi:hypothetical protein